MKDLSELSLYANPAYDDSGLPIAALVIVSPDYQLVIRIRLDEIELIPQVHEANWQERTTLRIGQSADADVWWSSDAEGLSLLVGHDDQSWSIAFNLPLAAIDEIVKVVEPLRNWIATTPPVAPTGYGKGAPGAISRP